MFTTLIPLTEAWIPAPAMSFAAFVASAAVFTASTTYWTTQHTQHTRTTPSKLRIGTLVFVSLALLRLAGVTPEELVLLFCPLIASFGMACGCFFGGGGAMERGMEKGMGV